MLPNEMAMMCHPALRHRISILLYCWQMNMKKLFGYDISNSHPLSPMVSPIYWRCCLLLWAKMSLLLCRSLTLLFCNRYHKASVLCSYILRHLSSPLRHSCIILHFHTISGHSAIYLIQVCRSHWSLGIVYCLRMCHSEYIY